MNYVGQLAGQVFVTVKELYKGLNPATLSGCIDIIVVRQPNGTLQCSPFHVRFGKMGVLRSREKVVDIEINGESVDLHMKLGDNGEAFFVQETDNDQEVIPTHLATSPILSEGASRMECQLKRGSADWTRGLDPGAAAQAVPPLEASSSGSLVKKRRKRRRKHPRDSLRRDEPGNTSEDEDMFPIEMSSDEERELLDGGRTLPNDKPAFPDDVPKEQLCSATTHALASYPGSDRDWSSSPSLVDRRRAPPQLAAGAEGGLSSSCPPQSSHFHSSESPSASRPSTPKSDSELVSRSLERAAPRNNPEMLWLWGELPQAAESSLHKMKDSSPLSSRKISEKTYFQAIQSESSDTLSDPSPASAGGPAGQSLLGRDKPQVEMQFVNEEDAAAMAAAALPLPSSEEPRPQAAGVAQTASKTDSPRKKDKRSRHLGADGVYLDELTDMDPEVAALYFPKNGDPSGLAKHGNDSGSRSANQSPHSVGSSGADSGMESPSDGTRDLPSIAISLCGGLSDHREITKDVFLEQAVSYQQFVDNPAIIDDPNLVVKIGNKYYNWTTAAPLLLAMQAFQKPLPKSSCLSYLNVILDAIRFCFSKVFNPQTATVESIVRDKMPRKGGRWWFSWRGRNTTTKEENKPEQCLAGKGLNTGEQLPQLGKSPRIKHESSSSDDEPVAAKPPHSGPPPLASGVGYKKTLRLSSQQLKSLKLKNGPNDVAFSVTTQYQGTCRCEGTIYLWDWDDKVVISDIDGTITRSDTLGHILPTLGKDWTHQGIAKLYHKVSQNGYKFLYCSARAIGMADMTRGYLHWVNERGTVLPQGPLLLSPSSLFSALHREVIEKKPEKFKVQCLTDIKNLFFPNTEPFYAAFGNRPADVYSYKQVGVSLNRIFTVNPKGELVQEHAKTNISSYVRLCEVVDHVFPLLKRSHSSDFPCSDTFSNFTFWREPLPPFGNQDVHLAST
ncbi:phosphatidate phosphatase LPIN1 isoform X2 [Choloepus didactylus]|uniref:phosphatidate phosphatase LPIN1 isoform X2 n=1 Tax=Choloepus didactylus TaxID=27675 RepID=UPI00189D3AF3|nr:phosphatidate phosphatase LPIN1 isoform X2 [Choloepus didactylus]